MYQTPCSTACVWDALILRGTFVCTRSLVCSERDRKNESLRESEQDWKAGEKREKREGA